MIINGYAKKTVSILLVFIFISTNVSYGAGASFRISNRDTLSTYSKMQTDISYIQNYLGLMAIADHFFEDNKHIDTLPRIMRHKYKPWVINGIDLDKIREDGKKLILEITVEDKRYEVVMCKVEDLTPEEISSGKWNTKQKYAIQENLVDNRYIVDLTDKKAVKLKVSGGKGASLAKMTEIAKQNDSLKDKEKEIKTKEGFVVSVRAFKEFLGELMLEKAYLEGIYNVEYLSREWIDLDIASKKEMGIEKREVFEEKKKSINIEIKNLSELLRNRIKKEKMPEEMERQIREAYAEWVEKRGKEISVFVRSSGESEDAEEKAFAGAYDTYENVIGVENIIEKVISCWASNFNYKSIVERNQVRSEIRQSFMAKEKIGKISEGKIVPGENAFSHDMSGLAVVVQEMIQDPPVSFVGFSVDPVSGRPGIRISAARGYGKGLVDSKAPSDSWFLSPDGKEILERNIGIKIKKMGVLKNGTIGEIDVPKEMWNEPCLSDEELKKIAKKVLYLKGKYGDKEIDCEGALELDREVIMLQARPETKYSDSTQTIRFMTIDKDKLSGNEEIILESAGMCASKGAASGILQVLSEKDFDKVSPGVILVTPYTDHNWSSQFSMINGVITDGGDMISHAGITGRENDIPVRVDSRGATKKLKNYDGQRVTFDAMTGIVYLGELPLKGVEEKREIWLKEPELMRDKTIEDFWRDADVAGQTVVDEDGTRWIGRPNYSLKRLQYEVYIKAFKMLKEEILEKDEKIVDKGLVTRDRNEKGIVDVLFEENCKIDEALRNLSVEELEQIIKEKKEISKKFIKFCENFEPTPSKIKEFIDIYIKMNYYMDLGFQFDEACNLKLKEQLKYVNPDFQDDFVDLLKEETESVKKNKEIDRLVEYVMQNHFALFTSTKNDSSVIATFRKSDMPLFEEIVNLVENYKGFVKSHFGVRRPVEEAVNIIRKRVVNEKLRMLVEKYRETDKEFFEKLFYEKDSINALDDNGKRKKFDEIRDHFSVEIRDVMYVRKALDKIRKKDRNEEGFYNGKTKAGHFYSYDDQFESPVLSKPSEFQLNSMIEFAEYVIGKKNLGEKKGKKQTDDSIKDNIENILNMYPNFKRMVELAVESKSITENMHHFKVRGQWKISDGLYELGEVLRDRGDLRNAADIFDVSIEQLNSFIEKPLPQVIGPVKVSAYLIDRGEAYDLDDDVRISLGQQIRIEAHVKVKNFDKIFEQIRREKNGAKKIILAAKLNNLAKFIKINVRSNLDYVWKDLQPMESVEFDEGGFRFKTVLTPKRSGTFSYAVVGGTIFQDKEQIENLITENGKIIVERKHGEEIQVDLDGIEDILNTPEKEKEITDIVRKASKRIKEWDRNNRLGFRTSSLFKFSKTEEIKEHVLGRLKEGVKDVVLIGMGGAIFPNRMLHEALTPDLYNEYPQLRINCPRIHLIDNLDPVALYGYLHNKGLDPLTTDVCILSTSGNSTETLLNAHYFIEWLKDGLRENGVSEDKVDSETYKRIIVISNDLVPTKGVLNSYFRYKSVKKWDIPTQHFNMGCSFTAFSPAGFIAAAYSGLDLDSIVNGAEKMDRRLNKIQIDSLSYPDITINKIRNNLALKAALLAYQKYKEGNEILVLTTYSSKLRGAANFLRQIIGESLSKDGVGPYPIIATGDNTIRDVVNNSEKKFFISLNYLAEKSLVPNFGKHPFMNINLPQLEEYTAGELVYFFQEFVLWYAALLGIDPRMQPKVEKVKEKAKKKFNENDGRNIERMSGATQIELFDKNVYLKKSHRVKTDRRVYANKKDANIISAYFKDNLKDTEEIDIYDAAVRVTDGIEKFYQSEVRSDKFKNCLVLGDREEILKVRSIYEAFYGGQKKERTDYMIEFIDETRKERLEEFISCSDARSTLVLILSGEGKKIFMNANFEKVLTYMKGFSQNIVYAADVTENNISENVKSHIKNVKKIFPKNDRTIKELKKAGLSQSEILSLIIFGITSADIKSFVKGYLGDENTHEIARKLAAYSYLLYQNVPEYSCNVNMLFSYSSRFSYFNSWIKHLFWDKFSDIKRGPVIDSSIGSEGHHTILEGMLGWKNRIFTIFIRVQNSKEKMLPVLTVEEKKGLVPDNLNGKNLDEVLEMLYQGVSQVFVEEGRPNVTISLPDLDLKNFGALIGIFERMTDYEKELFENDIKANVPARVASTTSILRLYTTPISELDPGINSDIVSDILAMHQELSDEEVDLQARIILSEQGESGNISASLKDMAKESARSRLEEYESLSEIDMEKDIKRISYHYGIIRQLYDYKDRVALKAIFKEMMDTGRSFSEVVCGIVGAPTNGDGKQKLKYIEKDKVLETNAVLIGGGGFGTCSLSRGINRFFEELDPRIKVDMPRYSVGAITTSYDDGGNSKEFTELFLKFMGVYVPALGDPAAIISWLTISKNDWITRHKNEGYKPENNNPKMDLLYVNDKRITLSKEENSIEKYLLRRIEELNEKFRKKEMEKPKDWLFFVANILSIAKIFDKEFVSQGKIDFEKISGQNLLVLGALLDEGILKENEKMKNPNMEKAMEIMGVDGSYVIPVTYAQESQGASITGHLDNGRKIFGQYNLTKMETRENVKVEYITLQDVSRDIQARETGRDEFHSGEIPTISPEAKSLVKNARDVIISGPGSIFTSVTVNLITEGVVDALKERKGDVPRVLVLPVMESPETANHDVKSLIAAIEKSVRVSLKQYGYEKFKLSDVFDYVIMADVPEDIEREYIAEIKKDRPRYLNEEGRKVFFKAFDDFERLSEDSRKEMRPKFYKKLISIIREKDFQDPETRRGLAFGSPKLDKILTYKPFPVDMKEDVDAIREMGMEPIVVKKEEGFFIWEGKIHYFPDYLVNKINEARIDFELEKFSKIKGFDENFNILMDIFGGENKNKEIVFTEIEKEALLCGKTVPEIVCGDITGRKRAIHKGKEIKKINHLSFGGGGWSNCSLMRSMEEMESELGDGEFEAAHLVPTVDNGGFGRVMGDAARKNIDMYVPIFGDFAGVASWLTGEWDDTGTFNDVTSKGAKMYLLYKMDKKGEKGRITSKKLLPEIAERIKEVQNKIEGNIYEQPEDWVLFVSNIIKLSRSIDEGMVDHEKLILENASTQNLMFFSAMLNSGVKKKMLEDGEIVKASIDGEADFAEELFEAFGVDQTRLQFQTYDPVCIVAILEGAVLRFGEDAVLLRKKNNRVFARGVNKDKSGNFITTPLTDITSEHVGNAEFKFGNITIRIDSLSSGDEIVAEIIQEPSDEESKEKVSFKIILSENKEGETEVRIFDEKNSLKKVTSDARWVDFRHKGVDFSVMGRRIEGQFDIAMEEHIARLEKLSLKKIKPRRDSRDEIIVGTKKAGWIDYDVSDDNADISATKWAKEYIEKTAETIRFDSGGALTQTAALMNKDIVNRLINKKDVPRIYIPPLMTDVIISGMSLKEIVQMMELSMKEAIGDSSVSFENVFSHIIIPNVPAEIQEKYLKTVRKNALSNVNQKGKKELEKAMTIGDIRNVLSDFSNLNKKILDDFQKDPGKIKAKMRKILPSTLLDIKQKDIDFLREKGIKLLNVDDVRYFGIWENKIVYEPRKLRDFIISVGDDFDQQIDQENDLKGDNALDADSIISDILDDNKIMEVSFDQEKGKLIGYMINAVDQYVPGQTPEREYRGTAVDLLGTLDEKNISEIISWILGHKVGNKLLKFRIAVGEPVLNWEDDLVHSNIAHAGIRDGVIYLGEGLFRYIFQGTAETNMLRKEVLDNDEYKHHLGESHGNSQDVGKRIDMVAKKIENLVGMIKPIKQLENNISKQRKEIEKNMENLHEINMRLIPEYDSDKVIWQIIQLELIPEFMRSDFVSFVRKLNNDYPDINEKIKIVSKERISDAVNEILRTSGRRNMINLAVNDISCFKGIPSGVKGLVFKGEIGEFCQIEGILASLRALYEHDIKAMEEIYFIMTGDILDIDEQKIINSIDDAEKLSEFFQFSLKPITGLDFDELKILDNRLKEFIVAA